MTVNGYLSQAIRILEGFIVAGIAIRCLKTIIAIGIEEGDWARAFKKVKNQVIAAVCAITATETLIVIRNIFGGR